MTGDFIVSIVSIMISRLRNDDVTIILSTVSYRVVTPEVVAIQYMLSF